MKTFRGLTFALGMALLPVLAEAQILPSAGINISAPPSAATGSGGAPSGPAGGVLSGTYPNPGVSSATSNAFLTGNGTSAPNAVAITGLVKGNGASAPGAATAGTDYAAPGQNHPQGTAATATAGQWATNDSYTSTAGFTLTLPASSTLNSNGSLVINPAGGTVTIQANAADSIWQNGSGGSAGGTLAVSGNAAILTTDAAGKLNVGWAAGSGATFANPTATIATTANNGVATTAMRSDASPAMGNLTGDITSAGLVTTLPTVNANVGSFGDATHCMSATVNAKGQVTAASQSTSCPGAGGGGGGPPNFGYQTSTIYSSPGITATATTAVTAGTTYFTPMFWTAAQAFTKLGIQVTVLAAGTCDVGIYANSGGMPSSTPLVDSSVSSAATGYIEATITFTPTAYTPYFLATQCSGAPTLVTASAPSFSDINGFVSTLNGGPATRISQTGTYGSAGSSLPTAAATASNSAVPIVGIKR